MGMAWLAILCHGLGLGFGLLDTQVAPGAPIYFNAILPPVEVELYQQQHTYYNITCYTSEDVALP